ncbi:MAG: lysophospholipid acyltransferase family protein [Rhodospirillales bacterium]
MQLIQWFVWFLGQMPRFVKYLGAKIIGFYIIYIPNQSSQVTRKNIDLAYPDLKEDQRSTLVKNSLEELCSKFFDLITTWVKPVGYSRRQVSTIIGLEKFQSQSANKPTLVLLPHIGNWELFGVWLTQYRSYTAMFRPLRVRELSDLVRQARERGGNHLVPATAAGVKQILKRLRQKELAIVLPDQAPKEGDGLYVPFFGHDVLTPVLPYRLALATDATVFIGAALKRDDGYEVVLKQIATPEDHEQHAWLARMNQEIEGLVRDNPAQYQWEYRRFRNAPDGTLRYP